MEEGGTGTAGTDSALSKDEKMWGMLCHLSALSGIVTCGLGLVVGPLVVWKMKREKMPFVDDQGKEALNFQITAFLAWVVCLLPSIFICLLRPLPTAIGLADLVLTIMAALKANEGVAYRYPFALRFFK